MEDVLALMIPILAVGGWIIPVTVKSVLKSQERRLECISKRKCWVKFVPAAEPEQGGG